ncbi:MAG: galactose oxidase [Fuerstiella sp.]
MKFSVLLIAVSFVVFDQANLVSEDSVAIDETAKASAATNGRGWQTLAAVGVPTARHEASFVSCQGKLYLIGGRRINPVDRFDPATNTWTRHSVTPLELHHFQAVAIGDAIYLVGAMTGKFPNEVPLEKVIVYYPNEDRFEYGHTIPQSRRRGAAGAAVYDGKIYIVGGITNGHQDGFQPWLDCYDPKTGDWTVLEDAAHARDHFQAVVVDHRLYAVAGRTTHRMTKQVFNLTVAAVDVFDLKNQTWLPLKTCPDLPVPRAGNMAINVNGKLVVGGGESGDQKTAHREVHIYDPAKQVWSSWSAFQRGRHGSGFAIADGKLFTASGSGNQGGSPELDSIERLILPPEVNISPSR